MARAGAQRTQRRRSQPRRQSSKRPPSPSAPAAVPAPTELTQGAPPIARETFPPASESRRSESESSASHPGSEPAQSRVLDSRASESPAAESDASAVRVSKSQPAEWSPAESRPSAASQSRPLESALSHPLSEARAASPLPESALPPPDVTLAIPEPLMASRVAPPEPERPRAAMRRAIFFDVENTSRVENVARILDHLAIDWTGRRTDFIAVGNWRVIGADTARLLARRGAQLVHSAPSTGVRDWSDLRIAVGAGVWLAGARPGDVIEVVSDDRAFDAVGDVAAALGITFVRRSYGSLAGMPSIAVQEEAPVAARADRGRRGRRRGRGGGRPSHVAAAERHAPEPTRADVHRAEPHTAPHDEVIGVVRELVARSGDRSVLIDTLANALKSRGFRRPPGSPRLITRLRRIRELSVSPNGMITLVDGSAPRAADVHPDEPHRGEPYSGAAQPASQPKTWEEDVPGRDDPNGNVAPPAETAGPGAAPGRRRRRSRRGGRGRRRRGSAQGAPSA